MKMNLRIFSGLQRFVLLWASQGVSAMGTAMTNYALVVWAYGQNGTASSVSQLTFWSFMPTILLRFIAGAAVDRWNKKHVMLAADGIAALGTLTILVLHRAGALSAVSLYGINGLMSCMNAFQVPAAYVTTSLLVPEGQYARAGGMQAVAHAMITILAPVLGSLLLIHGGLSAVLMVDLLTFAVAWVTLLMLHIPKLQTGETPEHTSIVQSCREGIRYLKAQPLLMRFILFLAAVNFLAKISGDGLMPVFVLGRTGGDEAALGAVQAATAVGLLLGGLLVTVMPPPKDSARAMLGACVGVFMMGLVLSVSRRVSFWCASAGLTYLFAAVMNVHWDTLMRAKVPVVLQGRVFAVRDTIQNGTIPLGLVLGGVLADRVFEPAMLQGPAVLTCLFGTGGGAGIAVQFFAANLVGLGLCLGCARSMRRP